MAFESAASTVRRVPAGGMRIGRMLAGAGTAPFRARHPYLLWVLPFVFTLPHAVPLSVLAAQGTNRSTLRVPVPMGSLWTRAADRAVLGVTLGTGSSADTAGVRLEAVEANGPAARAGLQAGDILTEVNGVSLKVAREDAEDLALTGLAQRRLQRVLAKIRPGDEVRLQYRRGGTSRSLTLKTVSAADLDRDGGRRVSGAMPATDDTRGHIGVTIGGNGNARDTLGLFVSAVTSGGPAERAGIVEGERVAAVNGVDVRIPQEDVEDRQVRIARIDRFVREVQKVAPGSSLTLRVYGNGRYRDVAVTAVKGSELPSTGLQVEIGNGGDRRVRVITPRGGLRDGQDGGVRPFIWRFDGQDGPMRLRRDGGAVEFDGVPLQEFLDGFRRRLEDGFQNMEVRVPGRSGTVRVTPRQTATSL